MYLTIGTVFKGDLAYLREWVAYHKIVGADHLYMLCNDADPGPARGALQDYISAGYVTFEAWATCPKLLQTGYRHILKQIRGRTHWLACIDIDEFILPRSADTIPPILRDFDADPIGGVCAHIKNFNSGGHTARPVGQLQIEAYLACVAGAAYPNRKHKSLVRTHAAHKPIGSRWRYKKGFHSINTRGEELPAENWRYADVNFAHLQVNHYVTRSREDYACKIARGWPLKGAATRHIEEEKSWRNWEGYHTGWPLVREDEIARRFARQVRAALGLGEAVKG